jgi:regulator of cell morphogenesis and NO signaling
MSTRGERVMTFDDRSAVGVNARGRERRGLGAATEEVFRLPEDARRDEKQVAEPCRFDQIPLTKLIAYLIDKHHVYARRQVAGISALLAELSEAHEKIRPELTRVRGLFKVLRQELLFHMEKEEVSLFPHIIRTEMAAGGDEPQANPYFGSMRDPVRMLMHEHDQLCAMLDEIRAATNDYTPPLDAGASYRTLCRALRDLEFDFLQLIHLQDNILFPRALRLESGERS